jgi:DNA-binding response OmpR family regulator
MLDGNISVLVVDDEPGIMANLEAFFEDEGFAVVTAATGEIAVSVLLNESVDVAIVDMRLPDIDGNEVIRRALAAELKTKFIIHTGSNEYRVPADFLSFGISRENVFLKPVKDMGVLSQAVRDLLCGGGSPGQISG